MRINATLLSAFAVACVLTAECSAELVTTTNIGEDTFGPFLMNQSSWFGTSFTTDGSAYSLQSVVLSMSAADNSSGNFTVRVYSDDSGAPGALLSNGVLDGASNPLAAGEYTYEPGTSITLGSETTYWLGAGVDGGQGIYGWHGTLSDAETGPWTIGDGTFLSEDRGTTWIHSSVLATQFNVNATAVNSVAAPEPSTFAFLAVGATGFACSRVRSRKLQATAQQS